MGHGIHHVLLVQPFLLLRPSLGNTHTRNQGLPLRLHMAGQGYWVERRYGRGSLTLSGFHSSALPPPAPHSAPNPLSLCKRECSTRVSCSKGQSNCTGRCQGKRKYHGTINVQNFLYQVSLDMLSHCGNYNPEFEKRMHFKSLFFEKKYKKAAVTSHVLYES